MWFSTSFVLIFIIVILLLSADFYYTKNIAGRRLVGLRWWNETTPPDPSRPQGDTTWVFEAPPEDRVINATDSRFFWISVYSAPVVWVLLAVVAVVRLEFIWLTLVVVAVMLAGTNGLAFSRADKFGNASSFAGRAWGGGLAGRVVGGAVGRMFSGR